MEATVRENRVLRVLVVLLLGVVAGDVVTSDGQQRVPGLGSGVVDVRAVGDVPVAQRGEWRVAQAGEWRTSVVGSVVVTGTVATRPAMPRMLSVGGAYAVRGPSIDTVVTIRELHESGWALVIADTGQQWINLAVMSSIRAR